MLWLRKVWQNGMLFACGIGVCAVIVTILLLNAMTRLRMQELKGSLQIFNEKQDDLRNVTLLSRIALINQRSLRNQETAAAYKQEAESALIAIRQTRQQATNISLTDRGALPLLNGFNRILGLPRIKLDKTPENEMVLDLAFQFETYREYNKAIRGYDVYLGEFSLTREQRDFALLHRGFCNAMLSNFDAALGDFEAVASKGAATNINVAQKLTAFLRDLKEKVTRIESISDAALRGEQYYNAAAYMKALDNFAQVKSEGQSEKIQFLTARALEETGRTKEALIIYRHIISERADSTYAVNANRRMYLLGAFFGQNRALAAESKKNSQTLIADREFMGSVSYLEKSANKLHEEIAKEQATNKDAQKAVDKIVIAETENLAMPQTNEAKKAPIQQIVVKPPLAKPDVIKSVKEVPLNLHNEKVAAAAEALAATKKTQVLKKQSEKIDKVIMADGNIFYGVIYKESVDKLYLYSVLGNLELDKTNIAKRDKVEAAAALK